MRVKIALVADLHGNMTALKALETDLQRHSPDEIWCLGDLVGKGPNSDLSFDWAIKHCKVNLRGNWDKGIGRKDYPRDSFYHHQLGKERMRALNELPLEFCAQLSGRKIRLIHGRPVMERLHYIQEDKDHLLPLLQPAYDLLIYADCHRQGLRTIKGQVANIGSVGNPLGVPMVQYALLEGHIGSEPAPLELRFVTLPYDREQAAQEALAKPDLPDLDAYLYEIRTGEYAGHIRKRRSQEGPVDNKGGKHEEHSHPPH